MRHVVSDKYQGNPVMLDPLSTGDLKLHGTPYIIPQNAQCRFLLLGFIGFSLTYRAVTSIVRWNASFFVKIIGVNFLDFILAND